MGTTKNHPPKQGHKKCHSPHPASTAQSISSSCHSVYEDRNEGSRVAHGERASQGASAHSKALLKSKHTNAFAITEPQHYITCAYMLIPSVFNQYTTRIQQCHWFRTPFIHALGFKSYSFI